MKHKRAGFIIIVVGVLLVLAVALAVWAFADTIATDDPILPTRQSAQQTDAPNTPTSEPRALFPILRGIDLLTEQRTIPADLSGDYRLIVVAYDVEQQALVDEWLPPLEDLRRRYPALNGYYVPLLPSSAADGALFIIGGMSLAAQNDTDRARTIVVFTDVTAFNDLLDIDGVAEIQLFLLNSAGEIMWRGTGAYQSATMAELEAVLAAHSPTPQP